MTRSTLRRIAIALMVGGALLVTYPAVSGGVFWDIGAACGYICLILVVCLYVFPLRGDGLPHARLLGLSQHKSLGWCVLGAAFAHVTILLLAEPLTALYLLPSAPLFMWCGVVSLLMLVALVITGLSARAQMRRSRTSQATLHVVLASLATATACAHIVGSSQLLSHTFKLVLALLLMGLPLGWYALRRRSEGHGASGTGRRSLARRASHLLAVALVALMPTPMSKQLLLEPVVGRSPIAVNFPHDSHTSVNCVTCHHNYVDHTGTAACIECHRNANAVGPRTGFAQSGRTGRQFSSFGTPLRSSSESTFHTFCRDCHTQLALDGRKHGPTRSCAACHQGIRSNNL